MADQAKQDMEYLLAQPQFLRFLFRLIQMARIFEPVTNGSDTRCLEHYEGRRSLGLEILSEVEQAQAAPQDDALMTIFQVLREKAQTPTEQPNGRRNRTADRYDRSRDLVGDDDGGG